MREKKQYFRLRSFSCVFIYWNIYFIEIHLLDESYKHSRERVRERVREREREEEETQALVVVCKSKREEATKEKTRTDNNNNDHSEQNDSLQPFASHISSRKREINRRECLHVTFFFFFVS